MAAKASEHLQQLVNELQVEHDLPGLSVAIADGDHELLVATAGLADIETNVPVTTETGFFIGSVSKNLFATIALLLVDRERLRLER